MSVVRVQGQYTDVAPILRDSMDRCRPPKGHVLTFLNVRTHTYVRCDLGLPGPLLYYKRTVDESV